MMAAAALCRASHRAIGHVVLLFVAVSSRVQCGCIRTALRAAFGSSRPTCRRFLRRPAAIGVFAGGLAARAAAPPGRRCPERERGAKAEGKTKGFGTLPPAKPVCTWGGAARGFAAVPRGARHAPQACPRASHARTRRSLQGAQP